MTEFQQGFALASTLLVPAIAALWVALSRTRAEHLADLRATLPAVATLATHTETLERIERDSLAPASADVTGRRIATGLR